jgi:hypothetical protein
VGSCKRFEVRCMIRRPDMERPDLLYRLSNVVETEINTCV